jgi:hypothetical protein
MYHVAIMRIKPYLIISILNLVIIRSLNLLTAEGIPVSISMSFLI